MKPVAVSALLLVLLGVVWRGDSHSWVGTEGKWGQGGLQDGRTWGQLSRDSKGLWGEESRGESRSYVRFRQVQGPEHLGLAYDEQAHRVT